METILVTGASGQLGRCIKDGSSKIAGRLFIFKSSTELDITSEVAVETFFKNKKIDYCINCAGYTAVDKAESEPEKAEVVNSEGAKNLALACKASGAVLIHISTDFVFNGNKKEAYIETDIPDPVNTYGKTKLKGENAIKDHWEKHFIVRTSWLYSEYGNNFMKSMIRLGSERMELSVVNDQVGTPTYARDLASFLLFLILKKRTEFGIYHYSNMGKTTWHGFAHEIFEMKKSPVLLRPIASENFPTPAKRPKFSLLNKEKLMNTFQLRIPDWQDSLRNALSNFEKSENP